MRASLGVVLLFLLVYALTCARTAQGGDASEFMTIAAVGGVAHPPGYPLFSLLVRLAGPLLPGPPAFAASLVSAALAALALGLLHDALRRLTGSSSAALVAAGALGFSEPFWRYATVSEVFALGALTAVLVLSVAVRVALGARGPLVQLLLGLAVATGIANHHTVVLLAPLAVSAFLQALHRRPLLALRDTLLCAGGQAVGFLLYLPLLKPGEAPGWGRTDSLAGLVHHVLRRDYGTFSLSLTDEPVAPWEHPLAWLSELPLRFSVLYALLAVLGLVVALRPGAQRRLRLALLGSLALAGPLFLSRFNLAADDPGLVVASRFHILPDTLLSVLVALGAAALPAPRRLLPLALAFLLAHAAFQLPRARHDDWTVLEDHLLNVARSVEPDAVLITSSDNWLFGGRYLQYALGEGRGLSIVHLPVLGYDWYREELRRAPSPLVVDGPRLADVLAAAGARPVYLNIGLLDRGGEVPPYYPHASGMVRLLRAGEELPPPAEVEAAMLRAEAGFLRRSRLETSWQARRTWEAWAPRQHAAAWRSLADAWGSVGDEAGRRRALARALDWDPWTPVGP